MGFSGRGTHYHPTLCFLVIILLGVTTTPPPSSIAYSWVRHTLWSREGFSFMDHRVRTMTNTLSVSIYVSDTLFCFFVLFHDGIYWYTTDFSVYRVLCVRIRSIRIVILCFRERTPRLSERRTIPIESWS